MIIVWGVVTSLYRFLLNEVSKADNKEKAYTRGEIRASLGSFILFGLEILIAADIIDTIAVMFSTEKMELIYQNYNMIEKQTIIDNIKKNKEEYRNKYENWISFLKKDRDYLFEKGLLNHGKEEVKELGIFYDIYLK